jgi:hypothetical protein
MIRTFVPSNASLGPSRTHPAAIFGYLEDELSSPVTQGPSLDWGGTALRAFSTEEEFDGTTCACP